MGWCSGTDIFDAVVRVVLDRERISPEEIIRELIEALESNDWDCESDSIYWEHPLVQKVFREKYPTWFED